MAFTENEKKKYEAIMSAYIEKRRPPVYTRPELDIGYKFEGFSIVIFELRPDFRNPEIKRERPIAKTTYVSTQKVWKVFWQRADLKWHEYKTAEVSRIKDFLALVEADEYGCFWG